MELEEAIRIHIANERKDMNPNNHSIVTERANRRIRIFETAPRNSKALMPLVERKKRELAKARTSERTEILYAEVQTYERLHGMVRSYEQGKSLDGFAY